MLTSDLSRHRYTGRLCRRHHRRLRLLVPARTGVSTRARTRRSVTVGLARRAWSGGGNRSERDMCIRACNALACERMAAEQDARSRESTGSIAAESLFWILVSDRGMEADAFETSEHCA